MCTIIKNCGIVMSQPHGRWLFPSELLASQGFPTTPALLKAALGGRTNSVCSFNEEREDHEMPLTRQAIPGRKRSAVCGQAGNAMNVNMIGAAVMWLLGFVTRGDNLFSSVPASTAQEYLGFRFRRAA